MELNEITRKSAIDIIAMQKNKDGKDNPNLEVDIDNYLRSVVDKYSSERVSKNSHYLLSKFAWAIANATKENFTLFDSLMKQIGYTISRT